MGHETLTQDAPDVLDALEACLDELLGKCARLDAEVTELHDRESAWNAERTSLLERNTAVRSRVESIVSRLKSLEHP